MIPVNQRSFPINILYFLFHLNFTNLVRGVDSINHAEIVVTHDLYLNGKQESDKYRVEEKRHTAYSERRQFKTAGLIHKDNI